MGRDRAQLPSPCHHVSPHTEELNPNIQPTDQLCPSLQQIYHKPVWTQHWSDWSEGTPPSPQPPPTEVNSKTVTFLSPHGDNLLGFTVVVRWSNVFTMHKKIRTPPPVSNTEIILISDQQTHQIRRELSVRQHPDPPPE